MSLQDTMGFEIVSNVEIEVINKKRRIIKKTLKKHNKATRSMVTGLLRFLSGHFTATNANSNPYYTDVEQYIPCYIGVGDGGVILNDSTGYPTYNETTRFPILDSAWNEKVPYSSTGLQRELFVKKTSSGTTTTGSRTKIRKVSTTISSDPAGDMDTVYFHCEIGPGTVNAFYDNQPVILTELGLFASEIPGTKDLLAYVKLSNYEDTVEVDGVTSTEEKTRTLFIRPEDTIIIKWYITIAAIGEDSTFLNTDATYTENIIPQVGQTTITEITAEDIEYDPNVITIMWDGTIPDSTQTSPYTTTNVQAAKDFCSILSSANITNATIIFGDNVDYTKLNNGTVNFSSLRCLNKAVLPNTLTTIPGSMFYSCVNLESVEFGNSVAIINNDAFFNCNLLSLIIPNTVTSIGNSAFSRNYDLTEVTIPRSVTYIGTMAFYMCHHLSNVYFDNDEYDLEFSNSYSSYEQGAYTFGNCLFMTSFTFPNGTKNIPKYMFRQCRSLKTITIPSSVEEIDNLAFDCTGTPAINNLTLDTVYLGNHSLLSGKPWGGNSDMNVVLI